MTQGLSPNVVILGLVSLLMGMSSAMIYGLLPVFLVTVVGASVAVVGVIEGIAEATTSFTKIVSGTFSDWLRRRKPLVLLGYSLSAVNKLLFPVAETASAILVARMADRVGKGIRDAPRDAFLADIVPTPIRGAGFGLRLALYTIGAIAGPLIAMALMRASNNDFRLVFWIALIPAFASIFVLFIWVNEPAEREFAAKRPLSFPDLTLFAAPFWWALGIAVTFALARFSPAFIVLKAHKIGIETALVPAILMIMYVVYSAAAYPFGILADHIDRRAQLGIGAGILIVADLILAYGSSVSLTALGAALWGLQMGVTQGLLSALVADAAPVHLRGTTFGIYDCGVGIMTFLASAGAGALWAVGGPKLTFGIGSFVAVAVLLLLLLRSTPKSENVEAERKAHR